MNPLLSSGFTRHQSRNFGLTGGGAVVCPHPGSCPQNTCSRPRPGPQPRSARAGPVPAARVLPARVRRLPRAAHPWRGRAAHRRRHRTRRCSAVLTPFAVPARDAGSSQALPATRMPPAAPNGSTPPEARGRGAAVTGAPPILASLPAPRPLFLPGRPASPRMAPTPGQGPEEPGRSLEHCVLGRPGGMVGRHLLWASRSTLVPGLTRQGAHHDPPVRAGAAPVRRTLCIRAAHGTPTPRWGSGRGRMTRVSTCSRHRGETSGLARLGTMTRWEHDGPPDIRRAVVW